MRIRRRLLYKLVFIALLTSPAVVHAQEAVVYDTPEKLWRDFDPQSPDLDIESIKKWEENGASFEKLRFTSEREVGGKVRVFAIRGAPLEGAQTTRDSAYSRRRPDGVARMGSLLGEARLRLRHVRLHRPVGGTEGVHRLGPDQTREPDRRRRGA